MSMGNASMPMEPVNDYVSTWLNHLRTELRYSIHTLHAYATDMQHLRTLYPEQDLLTINNTQVRLGIARLHAHELSPRSLARILSTWRSFYKWLATHYDLAINPAQDVRTPKVPRALPKALSTDQTMALLDNSLRLTDGGAVAVRDQAMIELMYSSGLRLAELVGLDIHYHKSANYESQGWLNLQEKEVTVRGKGKKTRLLPLGDKALQAIELWLEKRALLAKPAPSVESEMALFLGERGGRISPRVVQLQLKKMGIKTNAPTHLHPHVLRHSFASHLLQSSQDLRAVQELLGHANISTTQIYTRLDFQHLAKVYDQAHPRAKKKS